MTSFDTSGLYRGEREEDMFAFEQNGHLISSRDIVNVGLYLLLEDSRDLRVAELDLDQRAYPISYFDLHLPWDGCSFCGEKPELDVDKENRVVRATEPCSVPDGIVTEFYLDVPSGKIVVDDDLRDVYDTEVSDTEHSYNTALGQSEYIKLMEERGCAYGPVGNSCPGLYQTGVGKYAIMSPEYDEDDEELDDVEDIDGIGKPLAGIVTDLWAYSIADYDDYVSKGGKIEKNWAGPHVVEVPAGRYKFVHLTGERGFDGWASGEIIYATMEKVD